jgi:hypothetical protein
MGPRVPETLIRSIAATYAPRRIVLFGSQAQHAADPDSDLDLLVVLDDDAPPEACCRYNPLPGACARRARPRRRLVRRHDREKWRNRV